MDTIKIIQQSVLNALMAAQYAKTYNYALTVLMAIFWEMIIYVTLDAFLVLSRTTWVNYVRVVLMTAILARLLDSVLAVIKIMTSDH